MSAKRSNNNLRIVLELDATNPSSPYLILAKSLPSSAIHDLVWVALCSIVNIDCLNHTSPSKSLFVFRRINTTTSKERKGFISTLQLLNVIHDFSPVIIGSLFQSGVDLMDPQYLFDVFQIDPVNPSTAFDYEELDNWEGEAHRSSLLESIMHKRFAAYKQTRKPKGAKPKRLLQKLNPTRSDYLRTVDKEQNIKINYAKPGSTIASEQTRSSNSQTSSTLPIKSGTIEYSEHDTDNEYTLSNPIPIQDAENTGVVDSDDKFDVAVHTNNETKALPNTNPLKGADSSKNQKTTDVTASQNSDPSLNFLNNMFNDSI